MKYRDEMKLLYCAANKTGYLSLILQLQ